jgi:hypothetical protein
MQPSTATRRTIYRQQADDGSLKSKTKNPDCIGVHCKYGAGNETRTRDPNLGKVVLYQLSYSRIGLLATHAVLPPSDARPLSRPVRHSNVAR